MIDSILKVIQGWVKIKGNTDGTFIGNEGDALKIVGEVTHNGALASTNNSTSTTLNANQTFTGTSEDVLQYGVINIAVRSDVSSATSGLKFLFSTDNVNFYTSDEYTINAGEFKAYSIAPVARYFKIQYQNGSTNQSQFILQTVYKQWYVKPSSHRLGDSLSPEDDAEVIQSVLVAKQPDGTFTNINTNKYGNLITEPSQSQKDAFDRQIVVQPTHLASFDYRFNKHSDDFDEVISGSATSVHNATTVSLDLTCTTASGDSVKRQSFESFEYVRGNTQQGIFSLNLNGGPKTNNIRLFGLGDAENGSFIGVDGTGFFVMRRSKTSGSVVDTKTYQTSFNVDKLDGTGKSGVVLDLTKQNLFQIAYSWLGTNVIIYTLTIGGNKIPFHMDNVGNSLPTAWCQSGQLPLYFENTNTGTVESSTTFKVGCAAVFSFGSSKGFKEYLSTSSGATAIAINTTDKVCAGIRVRPGRKYVYLEPSDFQLQASSGTTVGYYRVLKNATLTGDSWSDIGEISQVLTNNPTFTGGTVVQEGYFSLGSSSRVGISIPSQQETTLGVGISGTTDSLIIVVRTDSGNGSFFFAGSWKEVF